MQEQQIKVVNLDNKPWIIHYDDGDSVRIEPSTNNALEFVLLGKINTVWNHIKVAQRKTVLVGIPPWYHDVVYLVPREYFQAFTDNRKKDGFPNDVFTHGENAVTEYVFNCSDDDSESEGDIAIEKEEVLVCYDGLLQEI